MAKEKKKPTRSSTQPSKAGDLKAQLARLPVDQLIAIVETFLARVGEKQRLEFLNRLGEELFRAPLSAADRDQQIDWIVQMLRPRIERIVKGKSKSEYANAAHDTRLIAELHRLQGQSGKAQQLIAGLHAQYQRHRNFRAELKKLGLG